MMTDEQFNLYLEQRRAYRKTCSDLEAFKDERSRLDEVYRMGSLPPEREPLLTRILVRLGLKRKRMTRLDGKRLQEMDDRLKYLDEVVCRAERVRTGILSMLQDYEPTTEEMRLVDILDAVERITNRQEALERMVKVMLK